MIQPEGYLDAAALFQQHAHFVSRLLARLGVPPQDIADLVQDIFLIAHSRGGYTPGPARPSTWLATIAIHVAQGARRARRRPGRPGEEGAIEAAVSSCASPFEAAVATEELARLSQALDALEFGQRAVFVMFELEGESRESIAEVLDIPLGTVDSRLHAARRKVKEAFARAERPSLMQRLTQRVAAWAPGRVA